MSSDAERAEAESACQTPEDVGYGWGLVLRCRRFDGHAAARFPVCGVAACAPPARGVISDVRNRRSVCALIMLIN